MSLPDGFLDDIRSRVSLAEVIGKQVRLTRRGREYLGLCPFHGEKTPSFTVNPDKGFYHCFGCGAHGSLFDFVMQTEQVGFREAVERLAAMAGLSLPAPSPEAQARDRQRRSLRDALDAAGAYYQKMLRMPEGKPALDYLRARSVSETAIEGFRLGYAPDGRYAVKAALAREGFAEDVLVEAGLLIRPEDDARGTYDRFRGRVMFPIADGRGRITGFGGRILGPGEPKYLNTPETPLFHKGRLLYGLDRAAATARTAGTIIVVEGYMDVIGMAEAGWHHTVAPLGTALTDEQLRLLWQLAPEPILLFDPDAAGGRAAARAAERALPLLKPGLGLKFAMLAVDTGDDPDKAASRYPPQLVHRTLAEAAPLSEFLFRLENDGHSSATAEQRAGLEARLKARTETIVDPVVRSHFQRAFRERLWAGRRERSWENRRDRRSGARQKEPPRTLPVVPGLAGTPTGTSGIDDAECTLLCILLRHPDFFHAVEDDIGALAFTDAAREALRQSLVQNLSGRESMDTDGLVRCLEADGHGGLIDALQGDPKLRRHRMIASDAQPEDVRLAWQNNLDALRRLARETTASGSAAGALARIIVRQRATAGDDE